MAVALVVDDDTLTVELYRYVLARAGHTVHTVSNGIDGLHTAQELLPDCIILNIYLPQMRGTDVCRHLKADERTAHIPVLMCSAGMELQESNFLAQIGADAALPKPFSSASLIDALDRLLGPSDNRVYVKPGQPGQTPYR